MYFKTTNMVQLFGHHFAKVFYQESTTMVQLQRAPDLKKTVTAQLSNATSALARKKAQ